MSPGNIDDKTLEIFLEYVKGSDKSDKIIKLYSDLFSSQKNDMWTTTTTTTTWEPPEDKPDTFLGELHFDIDAGELYVLVGDGKKKKKLMIHDINDFKKLATKKLLRK